MNSLMLSSPDESAITRFFQENTEEDPLANQENRIALRFHKALPLKDGEDYQVKWGTRAAMYTIIGKGKDHIQFDTAWSPPIPWLKHVSTLYPDIRFRLDYEEENDGYQGYIDIYDRYSYEAAEVWELERDEDGEVISEDTSMIYLAPNIPPILSQEFKKEIELVYLECISRPGGSLYEEAKQDFYKAAQKLDSPANKN